MNNNNFNNNNVEQYSQIMDFLEYHKGLFIAVLIVLAALIAIKYYASGTPCKIEKNLQGQIAVVTGGNTGIGYQTAKRLCELGCKVIIGARDQKKNRKAVQTIKELGKGQILAYKLDLSKRQQIQQFVNYVKGQVGNKCLNYLINNAGTILIPEKRLTAQGVEMQLGVNHFGHFYLTSLLWPLLKKCDSFPRITNVSSVACQTLYNNKKSFNLTDINFKERSYSGSLAYKTSKVYNVMFANQLQKRMDKTNFNALSVSLHPGVVFTECTRQLQKWAKGLLIIVLPILYFFLKTPKQGAQTTLYTILESQDKIKKGGYYKQSKPYNLSHLGYMTKQNEQQLWQISEKVYNIKFDI